MYFNNFKNSPIIFIRLITLVFLSLAFFAGHYSIHNPVVPSYNDERDSVTTISIGFVGDLMCHQPIFESSRIMADSFDFSPIFKYVKDYLTEPDVLIGNLETVTAGKEKKFTGYPKFNTPDEYVRALKDAGFDFLVSSNNHSMDRGEYGVLRTIEILRSNNLNHTGTFISAADRDSIRIIERNGISFAMLNYTYGTNGNKLPGGKDFLVNLIDTNLIKTDIAKASSLNPDLLIVCYHFGTEYKRTPDSFQKRIVEFTKRSGADIIIGSHPHVIQRMEYFGSSSGRTDTGFAAFSLGNFLSNQQWRYSDAGVILNLKIEKNLNTGIKRITSVNPVPTMVYISREKGRKQYYILPATELPDSLKLDFLKNSDLERLERSRMDTYGVLYSTND